jgi:hypothetical protein
MAQTCSICDFSKTCPVGCYIICRDDCTDCKWNCEPPVTVKPDPVSGVFPSDPHALFHIFPSKEHAQTPVRSTPYPYDTKLKLCFKNVKRSTLAGVLSAFQTSAVRAAQGLGDERISGHAAGTAAGIAAELSLIVE